MTRTQRELADIVHNIHPDEIPRRHEGTGFDAAWEAFIAECHHNFLIDSPMGRSAFAWGAAFIIHRLQNNWSQKELEKLTSDVLAFTNAYMAGLS